MGVNNGNEPYYNVGLTDAEMTELIFLLDDEPVDEELLTALRRKFASKRKQLRKRVEGT